MPIHPSPLLRRVLLADAVLSGAFGLLLLAGADLFADLLALPAPLLRYAGLLLLPFAVWVAYLARQERSSRHALAVVVAINGLWVIDSVAILAFGWVSPNLLGLVFVLAQALLVAAFAATQALGLRGSRAELAAA